MHWFPWGAVLRKKMLSRPTSYTLGTLGYLVPFAAWALDKQQGEFLLELLICIAVSGFAVFIAYSIDNTTNSEDNQELVEALEAQIVEEE